MTSLSQFVPIARQITSRLERLDVLLCLSALGHLLPYRKTYLDMKLDQEGS